jgi:hypothetical protein
VRRFDGHRDQGCAHCALLVADLESFNQVAAYGLVSAERRGFAGHRAVVRAWLLRHLNETRPSHGSVRHFSWGWVSGIAAAALVCVALTIPIVLREGPSSSPLRVRDIAIAPLGFSAPPIVRGGRDLHRLWADAGAAYQEGHHARAAHLFAQIATGDSAQHDALLYQGVSLVLDGRSAEARPVLQQAHRRSLEVGSAGIVAEFWLGVAQIESGDPDGARVRLSRVSDSGAAEAATARDLLRALGPTAP